MNNLRMKWKTRKNKHLKGEAGIRHKPRPAPVPPTVYMSDAMLDLLANRYHANRICYLLDITFAAYLLAPKCCDRIARHMEDGGGCRIENGDLVVNHA